MIVLSNGAPAAARWLAHLVRASAGAIRRGDRFDDELPFEAHAILRLAARHGVVPLLHRGLEQRRVSDPLPESFREACWQGYYASVRRNVIALETGRDVLAALASADVAAAPLLSWSLLEGPESVYEDVGIRPLDDLEFIVKPADRARAGATLRKLGFRRTRMRGAARDEAPGVDAFHTRSFDIDLLVELHVAWAPTQGSGRSVRVPGDRFLDALCEASSPHAQVRAPTRLAGLLTASRRAGSLGFARWIWLLDLHRIVTKAPLDWAALVRGARAWRASAALYAGLCATRELLRTAVPKEVLAELAPGPLRRRLLHRSLAAAAAGAPRPARVANLLLGESWWDVARTAWSTLPEAAREAAVTSNPRVAAPPGRRGGRWLRRQA